MKHFVFGMLWLASFACKSTSTSESRLLEAQERIASPSPQEIFDDDAWNTFLIRTQEPYEWQPACKPASFRHYGEFKGAIVLFHGFTACPQQFFSLAEKLSQEGYDVFLPTHPGHGMRRGDKEAQYLPDVTNYQQKYSAFVKHVNDFMRAYSAPEKVVGGLSLGGALATAAVAEDPQLYQRALIMTPYYRLNPKIANLMGALKNIESFAQKIDPEGWGNAVRGELNRELGWGAPCEDEVARGRQGICKFTYSHLIAGQQFGYELSQQKRVKGVLQFVGVDQDAAIDNDRLIWFYDKQVMRPESQTQLCFYPKGTNHSLASVYDAPDENKFWLARFEQDALRFLTKGQFFSQLPNKILGFPECSTLRP